MILSIDNASEFRILIVDDKIDNKLLLISLLKLFGFQLREASNGQECLDISEMGAQLYFIRSKNVYY